MSLIVTNHPTFALFYEPRLWGAFRSDLSRFKRMLTGTTRPGPSELITNPTVGQIEAMFASAPRIATDIETGPEHQTRPWTGLDPLRAKIKCIGLGNTKWGLALDVRQNHVRERAAIVKGFANPNVVKVTHNGPWFDHRALIRFGFPIRNWEDTRDARRALSSTSRLRLAFLASIYDDAPPWKESEEDDEKGMVFTDVVEDLLKYCAEDCVRTARVDEGILADPEWKEERVQRLYRLHKELSVACAEMHTTGFPVDTLQRSYLSWILREEYAAREEELLALVNIPGFRCTPNDLRKLIFKRHETSEISRFHLPDPIDPDCWTETGACSVDFDSLLQIIIDPYAPDELKKIIRLYWRAESADAARSTFVESKYVDQAISPDGRLRPGWNSCGTDTGRFSCSQPNIMNLEQYLRHMYRAAPGHVLVHGDFSQLELRVMSAVSGDPVLAEAIATGDVYSADAKALYPQLRDVPIKDVKKVKPSARQNAKVVHLAFQYGAGFKKVFAQVLAETPEADYSKTMLVFEALKKRYKGTTAYWFREQRMVQKTGYSESRVLRRRRTYPREPPITEIANYPIQSTASDIANIVFLRIRRRLKKEAPSAGLVAQLHDAFDIMVPEKGEAKVREIMKEEMERPFLIEGQKWIFPTEIKVSSSWGDL